ncbi:hypothetical protein GXP67_36775 [Rhodocytophaga rosea]|uniref:RNA polymerase sigma-70 region 4 domain-containing protein n=1 Tax=Rhodocytophaga rosea TaxID=2704465 RepID=A0A6C0GVD4_9BACT|nr:sigma factor-like helix-turn-helix DNA-binding protein [Rhodocytophaga rosea]QHT71827.1 hypothetical protein GXP67_36775 [Rhodocytophaga rosea]
MPIDKPGVLSNLFVPEELWRSFTEGNQQAYSYIFVHYKDVLYSYGLTIVANEEMVCVCIQELFLDLWIKRHNLAQVKTIKYYLLVSFRRLLFYKMASNKKHLHAFRQATHNQECKYAQSSEPELIHEPCMDESPDKLALSIYSLPKRQKEVLYLRYYEKLSYEEIME